MSERIEGVPVGTRLVRVGVPKIGEWIVCRGGGPVLIKADQDIDIYYPVIVPDNVYGVIDLSTVPIPECWERDGDTVEEWFRDAKDGEGNYVSSVNNSLLVTSCFRMMEIDRRRIHVRKSKPKTRRVLVRVETRELTITDRPCGSIAEVHSSTAESLVKSQPHRYRIEERPL